MIAFPLWTLEPRRIVVGADDVWARPAMEMQIAETRQGMYPHEPEFEPPTFLLGSERQCERCGGSGEIVGWPDDTSRRICKPCHGTGRFLTPTDPWAGEGLPVVDIGGCRMFISQAGEWQNSYQHFDRAAWRYATLADLRARLFGQGGEWVLVTEFPELVPRSLRGGHPETRGECVGTIVYRANLTVCIPPGADPSPLAGLCLVGRWTGVEVEAVT